MFCATAAPTRYLPGETHFLPAPPPLVTTFAAGPLPANRASEVAARRLAAPTMGTRRPLSSPLSLSATPQLQPAQPLSTRVAKNAAGDKTRHATARLEGVGSHLPLAAFHAKQASQWQTAPDPPQRLHHRQARVPQVGVLAYLGGAAARGPVKRGPVAPPVVTHTVNGDAPTPTRPTSSVWCRPKRSRRHATRILSKLAVTKAKRQLGEAMLAPPEAFERQEGRRLASNPFGRQLRQRLPQYRSELEPMPR